jgi:hypothetical protein
MSVRSTRFSLISDNIKKTFHENLERQSWTIFWMEIWSVSWLIHTSCFYGYLLTYLLIYLQSWALLEKVSIMQPLENFPAFYGTRRFITVFTRAFHWSLSWARSIQSIPSHPISLRSLKLFIQGICPGPRLLTNFHNKIIFYGEELLASHATPKLEDHPLSSVRNCLFNIFAATLHIWRASPPSATWGRAMPWWQGTHLWLMLFNERDVSLWTCPLFCNSEYTYIRRASHRW